ncbi:MAG: PAS domain-containing protein [Bacteroidales bacterium]|nr:PAS domain-containing protein [Bacteroidales bacterium]
MNNEMIIENIPFGVILHNNEGLIIDANKQLEQIFKIRLKDIIGEKWDNQSLKIVNKEGMEYSVENHLVKEAILKGRDVRDAVFGIVHPETRDIIWVNTTTVFKPAESGDKTDQNQVLMYLSDITDIIHTTVTIESVIENLNLGTWQWNIETDCLVLK